MLRAMVKTSRKLHLWIGLLFAPTIIFFALSGALQVFGLHESEGGKPAPAWIAKLAEIHKEQSISAIPAREPRPAPAAAPSAPSAPKAAPRPEPHRSIPLVLWFAALAIGLVTTTGIGVYMAFAYKRDRATVVGLLAAGIVLPILFAFL